MKIRIKTYNGDLPDYLTVGRVYQVFFNHETTMIETDDKYVVYIDIGKCRYLNGGSWEIVNDTNF